MFILYIIPAIILAYFLLAIFGWIMALFVSQMKPPQKSKPMPTRGKVFLTIYGLIVLLLIVNHLVNFT